MLGFDVRIGKIAWTVSAVVFLLYLTYSIRSTVLILLYAIFFAYLIYPLVGFAERIVSPRVPRALLVGLVFIFVLAILIALGALLGSRIAEQAVNFSEALPKITDVSNISERIPLPRFLEMYRPKMVAFIAENVQAGAGQAVPFAKHVGLTVMAAAGNLIYLILIPVLSFLLIKDAPSLRSNLLLFLARPNVKIWQPIISDLDTLLAGYVRALLLLSLATFISYSTVFSFLGVPYALLLSGIAALLEFIPFIGPLTAAGVILAVAGFSGYEHLLWLVGVIFGYRGFQDYVLSPYLMSEGVEVSPLLVILGLLAGEQLGGVPGIFLSVPAIAAVRIIIIRLRNAYMSSKTSTATVAGTRSSADVGGASVERE
jgi:predicted PurR-regulated permease PerM